MQVGISVLDEREVVAASRLLARAFADDPIFTHYFDDPVRRAIAFPAFFEWVLQRLIPSAHVFTARSGTTLLGVAAWLPPEPVEPDEAARVRANRAHRIVRTMFPLTSGILFEGFAALEEHHPSEQHWYLAFLGIEPNMQNRGVGRELLAPVLKVADETKTMCYLETPFPRTHPFYEKLGFTRRAEHNTFPGAPQGEVTFVRRPHP